MNSCAVFLTVSRYCAEVWVPAVRVFPKFLCAGMAGTWLHSLALFSFFFLVFQPTLFPIWSECSQLSVDSKQ